MSHEQRQKIHDLLTRPSAETDQSAGTAQEPTMEQKRAGFARMMSAMRVPRDISAESLEITGRPALSVTAEGDTRPGIILYFHGGSHTVGSPQTAMSLTGALVSRTKVPAVSLDYRLAPENPYPADQEDCLAAYRELLDQGHDPASIVIAGDSAGGGLTVSTALRARDAGLPLPAGLVTFSAGTDYTRSGGTVDSKNGIDPMFTPETLAATSELYRAGADPVDPYLSPGTCADLAGLPPMLIQVGTDELLFDDSFRLAQRAWDAEVDVIFDVTAKVPHVFQAFSGDLDEADEALDRAAEFIRQRLGSSSAG